MDAVSAGKQLVVSPTDNSDGEWRYSPPTLLAFSLIQVLWTTFRSFTSDDGIHIGPATSSGLTTRSHEVRLGEAKRGGGI